MRSPGTEEEETSELTQAVPTLSQTAQWVEVDEKPHYFANQTLWPGTCHKGHMGTGNLSRDLSPGGLGRASKSMGNMPWANIAFMTKWVTQSICPFWTGTQHYPNGWLTSIM